MQSAAATVAEYLAELTDDRRAFVEAVRAAVNANLPDGLEEGMQYGMIGWYVPLAEYPAGYHTKKGEPLPYAALASQANYVSLYLMSMYTGVDPSAPGSDTEWLRSAWAATGRRLDLGKACVRMKKPADAALDVIGLAIARVPVSEYIDRYERAIGRR